MKHIVKFATTAFFFAATVPYGAFGQSDTTQLSGFVKDATGAVVPGAAVAATNEGTGLERSTQSNENGYYVLSSLPPGLYTVAVESEGFKRAVSTQNKLDPNLPATVDIVLELGAVTETIEVVADAARIQSETATVGKLVEQKQIQNTILNGRNPLFLALLKPGVRRGGSINAFSFGLTSGGFSINGSRSQDNIIAYDGAVNVRTRANGTSIGTADLETVQEMQILTANYNAEYGRSAGGQIRFVTRSGGRDLHGSFYEYFRNQKLDANTWSNNRAGRPREQNQFNQFGYIVDGPLTLGSFNRDRNKVFWLWGQEWVRRRRGRTVTNTHPTLAMRQGDFSELLDAGNPFFRRVRTITDPDTGEPFANNVIPSDRVTTNSLGMLNVAPEPTPNFLQGTRNFIQTRPQPADQRKDTLSIDVNPTEKHNIRFRFQNYGFFEAEAFRGNTDRANRTIDRPNQTYTLNHIYTISPTLVNEFLASFSFDRVDLVVPNTEGRANRSRYGIDYPYVFPERKEIQDKIPTIDINNFQRIDGGPYPASSYGPIYQISNNTTKTSGAHTLKFGVRWERAGQNDFDQINVAGVPGGTNNQNGRFVFTDGRPGGSGLAVANAALGLFSTYAEIGPRAYTPYRSHMLDWFVQDSWKPTQRLRIELGLRHTWVQPYYYSLWRNMAVFDPSRYDPNDAVIQDPRTGNVLGGNRFNGVLIPGESWPDAAFGRVAIADSGEFDSLFSGGSKTYGETHYANFQPRVGLAYRIGEKTVIRTGGGRFYARPGVADNIFLGGNPPFQPMASIANGQADDPGGGARTGFPQFFMTQDPVFKIPSAWNWNFTVEREIGFGAILEVGYVGRVGLHMERVRDINQLPKGTRNDPANNGIDTNALRPYKGFAAINMNENAARSEYNGLQIGLNRRFNKGFSFGVAYTFSESEDNADGRRDQIYDNYDASNFWGWSDFDSRHLLVINYIYELPFFKDSSRTIGKLLGGWQLSGVTHFQTGQPITVGRRRDIAGIGVNSFQPWEATSDPTLPSSRQKFSNGAADDNFFFNPDVWAAPAAGTFSSTQNRNSLLHRQGFQSWNVGVFKTFAINERHSFQYRLEMFNFLNHPNWGSPNTDPNSGVFAKITSKGDNRNIQMSLRYSF